MKRGLTFEEAVSRFQKFLEAQGWPRRVTWLRPGDACLLNGRVAIRRVSPNATFAHLGVGFEALCRVDGETLAPPSAGHNHHTVLDVAALRDESAMAAHRP
jgi:hypothetical protein